MAVISAWVIYRRPLDYPQGYVMRRWEIGDWMPLGEYPVVKVDRGAVMYATQQTVYAPTLEQVRRLVPLGCVNLRRQPADEAQIVETWM